MDGIVFAIDALGRLLMTERAEKDQLRAERDFLRAEVERLHAAEPATQPDTPVSS